MSALLAHAGAATQSAGGGGPGPTGDWSEAVMAFNPQIWMRLADTTSIAANDGTGSDGTLYGSPRLQAGALIDVTGEDSVGFSSASQYMAVPASGTDGSLWTGIVALVYRGRGHGSTVARVILRDANGSACYINLAGAQVVVNVAGSSVTTSVNSADVTDGEPHLFVLAILSVGAFKFYVDGVEAASAGSGYTVTVPDQPWHVARNSTFTEYTFGRYSNFIVAKGVFTQDQVDALHAAWAPKAAPMLTEFTSITWSQSSTYSGMTAASNANMRDSNATNPVSGTGTNSGSPSYVQADLGASYPIEMVTLGAGTISDGGWGGVASYLNSAAIKLSEDGADWISASTVSGLSDSPPTERHFDIPAIEARYVRIEKSSFLAVSTFRIYRE